MENSDQIPEYSVGLRNDHRFIGGQSEPKVGIAWAIYRNEGGRSSEVLFISPDVFDTDVEAKRDAVRKLGFVTCCSDSPLRIVYKTAIGWMTDES